MRRHGEKGFTMVEMLIAMTVMAMITVSIYGVVVIGARSAGAGERRAEQARRLRIATSLIVRQLRSSVPIKLADEDDEVQPFFIGEPESIEFVTAAPQRMDSSGLGVVSYWYEDGTLMMSEIPMFTFAVGDRLGSGVEDFTLSTPLFHDVARVRFKYLRTSHDIDDWEDSWDASEVDELPSVVRVEVSSDLVDGPQWVHEIPVYVGSFNEFTGEDDYQGARSVRGSRRRLGRGSEGDDVEDDEDDELDDEDEDE